MTTKIDLQQALDTLGGDMELLRSIAAIYFEDAPKLLRQYQRAVEEARPEAARMLIHSLKGLTGSFFAKESVEFLAQLESACLDGRLQLLQGTFHDVEQIVNQMLEEMECTGLVNSKL